MVWCWSKKFKPYNVLTSVITWESYNGWILDQKAVLKTLIYSFSDLLYAYLTGSRLFRWILLICNNKIDPMNNECCVDKNYHICKKLQYYIVYLQTFTAAISRPLGQLLGSFLSWNFLGHQSWRQMEASHGWDVVPPNWVETLISSLSFIQGHELKYALYWTWLSWIWTRAYSCAWTKLC